MRLCLRRTVLSTILSTSIALAMAPSAAVAQRLNIPTPQVKIVPQNQNLPVLLTADQVNTRDVSCARESSKVKAAPESRFTSRSV